MDKEKINKIVLEILNLKKKKGRLFFIGVGGSAANASHAVNDFRKLCGIESYSPIDNVSELTARINDEGWENSFIDWLKVSKLNSSDGIFIFSVGGGNKKKGISTNLIKAVDYAKKQKTKVFGIVGRNDGYVYKKGNLVLQVPLVSKNLLTPFSESFQAVVWHCLVSDPRLQINKTKW
jgi:D-sedoheptulose 7-phosphate isomerase